MFGTTGGVEFVFAGVPIRVTPSFFFVAVIFGIGLGATGMVLWAIAVFVSIVLHEMGHAVAYRAFGVAPSVVLYGMGGLTFGRSLTLGKDLIVSLAGPFAGFTLGLPMLVLWRSSALVGSSPELTRFVWFLVLINLGWGLVNLLPVLPLDGGHAAAALSSMIARRDTTRAVQWVGVVVGVGAALLAWRFGVFFAAVLFGLLAFQNFQAIRAGGGGRSGASPVSLKANVTVVRPPRGGPATAPLSPTVWHDPAARTFAQERDAAVRALLDDLPELALMSADRARKLGQVPAEGAQADELEAWGWLLLDRPEAAHAFAVQINELWPESPAAGALHNAASLPLSERRALVHARFAPPFPTSGAGDASS